MPFGNILSDFEEIELEDAEGNSFKIKNNFFSKLAFKIIGLPHIGMRLRARLIINEVKRYKNKKIKILDVGCGYGIYSFTLSKKGYEVYAIDNSKERINFLQKNGLKNARVMDITKLKYKNKVFDVVICSDVLEHVKNDKKALAELARVLDNKGRLLLTLPYLSEKNIKNYKKFGHIKPGYSTADIKNLAGKNKLKIRKMVFYSSPLGEVSFGINRLLYKNKFLLAFLFYPLYFLSLAGDFFCRKNYNGIFCEIEKPV